MELLYLDSNATTRPDPRVVDAVREALERSYGNPSSVHRFGQQARRLVDEARAAVAALLGCAERQVLFTSGGTESINAAIRGLLTARAPRRRIITSAVEHSATRELCRELAKEGIEVVEVAVDQAGALDLDQLQRELDDRAALVTLLWANNETGVIFPVQRIGELCRSAGVPFHCDAVQAAGKLPIQAADLGADLLSIAAHKFHGPKGVGGLYVRRGLRLPPLIIGGPQEQSRRGGTENVPGIAGMGVAAQLALDSLDLMPRIADLRDRLEAGILATIPLAYVNGSTAHRLPNTTNIGFAQLEAEAILLLLSERGVCASAGAACSSGSLEPSHVLKAMGIDPKIAHGSVRFSLSRFTTEPEIDQALAILPPVIQRLRAVLPA